MSSEFPSATSLSEEDAMSRRSFLKGLPGVTGSVLFGASILTNSSEASQGRQPIIRNSEKDLNGHAASMPEVTSQPESSNVDSQPDESYANTALMATGFTALNGGAAYVLNKAGVPVGNGRLVISKRDPEQLDKVKRRVSKYSRKEIYGHVGNFWLVTPAWEEAAYRLGPSAVANTVGLKGDRWGIGLATSALFAATHGFKDGDGENILPVPQFALGMFGWWLQRNRGYPHAALAHVINNTPLAVIVAAMYENLRKKHQDMPHLGYPAEDMTEFLSAHAKDRY